MPSWIPGFGGSSSSGGANAPTSSSFGGLPGGGRGGAGGQWLNLEVPGQVKSTYGQLTGEDSQFKEWGFDLTRRQRIMGFVGCLVGGFALSLIGTILLIGSWISLFAVLYSIGVILSLVGTGFLIGFSKQMKQMFKPVRIVATLVLLVAFVMVWVSAFAIKSTILAIVFVVVLYLAYIWYSLSYIPYARDFVKNMFSRLF